MRVTHDPEDKAIYVYLVENEYSHHQKHLDDPQNPGVMVILDLDKYENVLGVEILY